jgi:DNA-binding MarR family transcriptional regulator
MENEPSKAVVGAWIRLMRAQQASLLKIERAFRESGMPAHSWYDVLWELEQAGEKGLRPFEIERQILVAQSNISRLIDKLESAGYVERCPCEEDGRGQIVVITSAGRTMRKRMWPVYAEAISTVIGARISDREATSLSSLLDQLVDRTG